MVPRMEIDDTHDVMVTASFGATAPHFTFYGHNLDACCGCLVSQKSIYPLFVFCLGHARLLYKTAVLDGWITLNQRNDVWMAFQAFAF